MACCASARLAGAATLAIWSFAPPREVSIARSLAFAVASSWDKRFTRSISIAMSSVECVESCTPPCEVCATVAISPLTPVMAVCAASEDMWTGCRVRVVVLRDSVHRCASLCVEASEGRFSDEMAEKNNKSN